ncbi:MAG TPA: Crp/Fnr family transcriptional regulator [Gemmatimonadaceae bacterium]|jgi:CRP-like cAMP-binding protein|nr:Crp/Fnr family transcriptional regulator [Gemmatimonadaceae bacterium]
MSPSPVSPKVNGRNPVPNLAPDAARNNILSKLPQSELLALLELSTQVECDLRDVLSTTGQRIKNVYFPLTGMISLVTELKDGTSLESMTVGREGFAGLPLFHGVPTAMTMSMCQIEGTFIRLSADSFTALLPNMPELSLILHRYAQFAHEVVAQTAACNSMHLIEQRCARWLLISSDAVGKTELGLTHDFLSQMLAVRRPGVTVAIGALEKSKLIVHRYGKISILDKKGLEAVACECYRTVKDREQELLS